VFIGSVMVSVLVSKAVDRGFIGGVMVNVLVSKAYEPTIYPFKDKYANHYATDEPMIYRFGEKHANLPPINPRSTTFKTSTLTIMPPCLESGRSCVHR
jgi:hypothetical protein